MGRLNCNIIQGGGSGPEYEEFTAQTNTAIAAGDWCYVNQLSAMGSVTAQTNPSYGSIIAVSDDNTLALAGKATVGSGAFALLDISNGISNATLIRYIGNLIANPVAANVKYSSAVFSHDNAFLYGTYLSSNSTVYTIKVRLSDYTVTSATIASGLSLTNYTKTYTKISSDDNYVIHGWNYINGSQIYNSKFQVFNTNNNTYNLVYTSATKCNTAEFINNTHIFIFNSTNTTYLSGYNLDTGLTISVSGGTGNSMHYTNNIAISPLNTYMCRTSASQATGAASLYPITAITPTSVVFGTFSYVGSNDQCCFTPDGRYAILSRGDGVTGNSTVVDCSGVNPVIISSITNIATSTYNCSAFKVNGNIIQNGNGVTGTTYVINKDVETVIMPIRKFPMSGIGYAENAINAGSTGTISLVMNNFT